MTRDRVRWCEVAGCPGAMEGQMTHCAAHWSLLSEPLRLELVQAWDALELERRAGNPRRASRNLVRELEQRAAVELADVLVTILPNMAGYTPNGLVWRRTLTLMQHPKEPVSLNALASAADEPEVPA